MKAYYFSKEDMGSTITIEDVPAELKDKADEWHHKMVEAIAELDDALTEKFLMEEEISVEEMKAALRKGTLEQKAHPVYCGSALQNIGVQKLIDGVIEYLPNPTEVPETQGTDVKDAEIKLSRPHSEDAPLSALVFKIVNDAHGDLTYVRIYSGKLAKGTRVLNSNNGKKEIVSRIFEMHSKERIAKEEALAGEIVAVVGLKNSYTGETLCDSDDPIVLDRMEFPDPVISMSIEPASAGDKEKLSSALSTIRREDPSFRFHYDDETGETIIEGMGELHLEIINVKLTRDLKIGVNVGQPRVAYRETIGGTAEARGIHKKQSGGRGQFGDATIIVSPITEEEAAEQELTYQDGVAFQDSITGGAIPREYIPSVGVGARATAKSGVWLATH